MILPKNYDVPTIEKLFSRKQLAQLAYLKFLIHKESPEVRDCLMLMFSGLLNKVNLTYHSSEGRSEGRGDSSVFRYYRYRMAPKPAEVDMMTYFESRFKKVVAGKRGACWTYQRCHSEQRRGHQRNRHRTCPTFRPRASITFTPIHPMARKSLISISRFMWNARLDLPVSAQDYANEAIEGGEAGKTKQDYSNLLTQSIKEMARVLKYDRWMSFVFAHKDPAYWHLIIDAAESRALSTPEP